MIEYSTIFLKKKITSNLYFVQALSEQDCNTKKLRGFSNVRLLFQHLNASFFQYLSEPTKYNTVPLPRFYIAKNRTLLNEAGTDPNGALAVLYNVQIKPLTRDLYRLQATVVISEPMGETHGFDESSMDKSDEYEFCPKAWLKLRVIKVVENVNTVINADMDRSFFKKVYNTYKLSTKIPGDLKKVGDHGIAKEFVHAIINPKSNQPNTDIAARTPKPLSKPEKATASSIIPKELPKKIPVAMPVKITRKNHETSHAVNTTKSPRSSIKGKVRASASLPLVKEEPRQGSIYDTETVPIIEIRSPVTQKVVGPSKNIIRITPPVEKKNVEANKDDTEMRPTIRLIVKNREPPKVVSHDDDSSDATDSVESDSSQGKERNTYLIKESTAELEDAPGLTDEDNSSYIDAVSTSSVNEAFGNTSHRGENSQLTETNVSFERYMEGADTDTQTTKIDDTHKQYYIDASKELWKKLRDCKFFFLVA